MKYTHPIQEFWNISYSDFATPISSGIKYSIPGFSDPLLSATFFEGKRENFIVQNKGKLLAFNEIQSSDSNLISPPGFRLRNDFLLGQVNICLNLSTHCYLPKGQSIQIMPLAKAININVFGKILESAFPDDFLFLQQLLPFFCKRQFVRFFTAFLKVEDTCVGMVNIGIAANIALTLNAAILPQYRGHKFAYSLVQAAKFMAAREGAKEAIFWSRHEFMRSFADQVHRYRIFVKKNKPRLETGTC